MAQSRPLPKQELGVRGVTAVEGSPCLTDYLKLKTIGMGSFGKVLLVQHRQTLKYYALKVLEKAKVVNCRQCYHVVYEKDVLMSVNCTFVVKLHHTFKDNCNLFMLMEYVQGGEMFHHLREVSRFSESRARFYAAQIVLAFEYLHSMNIIYRDLKPENVLIDHTGYIKLTDFGFAKKVKTRTWTMCGTPDYMAPEIILSRGYNQAVDWWALGILIFEMISGFPPFYTDKPSTTYELIVAGDMQYPMHFTPDLRHLLCNLLQPNPDNRYGYLKNGVLDLKQHSWFTTIDWVALGQKKYREAFKGTRTTTDNRRTRNLTGRVLKSLLHEFRNRTFPRKSYICLHFQLGNLTPHVAAGLAADPYVLVAAACNKYTKKVYSPFVPKVKSPEDVSNFDSYDEEPLPVSAIERFPREFSDF